jgi:hypothetical protein
MPSRVADSRKGYRLPFFNATKIDYIKQHRQGEDKKWQGKASRQGRKGRKARQGRKGRKDARDGIKARWQGKDARHQGKARWQGKDGIGIIGKACHRHRQGIIIGKASACHRHRHAIGRTQDGRTQQNGAVWSYRY